MLCSIVLVFSASSPFYFPTHLPSTHGFPLYAMASVGRLFGFCLSNRLEHGLGKEWFDCLIVVVVVV